VNIEVTFKKNEAFDGYVGLYVRTDFDKNWTSIIYDFPSRIIVDRTSAGVSDFNPQFNVNRYIETVYDYENEDTIKM
jgi:hypothetical protein